MRVTIQITKRQADAARAVLRDYITGATVFAAGHDIGHCAAIMANILDKLPPPKKTTTPKKP